MNDPIPSDSQMSDQQVTMVEECTNAVNQEGEQQEQQQQQAYMVYSHNVKDESCRLVATTGSHYNTTVHIILATEASILQHPLKETRPYNDNDYFKNVKWSPDGTCLLSNSNDNTLRLFNTSCIPIVHMTFSTIHNNQQIDLRTGFGIHEGEAINDFAWFPSMNSQDPATCCFLTSVRDHPMHLWDGCTGQLRASYSVIDHRERFVGPNVISFNPNGTHIYCGYENMIEIFDVQRPGQASAKIPTIPNRKSKQGQKGIISCLDFSVDGLYAAGSYSQSVGIYDETNNELCLKLTGIQGGVTQVRFTPDGNFLYTASRTSNVISCWDIRDTANVLYELPRPGKTSQRITFDIDPSGKTLVSGDQYGNILFYDISNSKGEDQLEDRLLYRMEGHRDITSCATWNPMYPWLLATCSGQRKFELDDSDSDSGDGDDNDRQEQVVDNSLSIWQVPGTPEWYSLEASS
ncbi:telomerase cajal body protein 1-like [Lichtheimia corymbifera JMRC:FSU:9682]|uniref:Telomerase cajal body protein 1-like n=1 Tax=Lichtheimia corymbifera JMRC:FSU:9682 TaxID=1263082 RepID=A0A068S7F9_9FUNG|nr:telomerase cajal body protein 1-like [Lichtheimia corymbifera JMRC:FSU:9682]